jgi:ribosomal protein S18 acetylase RimI-like enzyme
MSLPGPLRSFWYAAADLGPIARTTPWGLVKADPRYPLLWDANHAAVLEPSPGLTLAEIRAELIPVLEAVGAQHDHVEFWDLSSSSPALAELRASGDRHDPDVMMVFEDDEALSPNRPRAEAIGSVQVREIAEPDDAFWGWYRQTRRAFGVEFSDEVVDQLVDRDREVFHPAGLRWFVGFAEGEMAGFASLISLERVGYVDNVVTLERFRRRGVATATVVRAVSESRAGGDELVHLLAVEGGAPQRLYERLGFRTLGRVESFTRPLEATGKRG